jgi:hypothetical protein
LYQFFFGCQRATGTGHWVTMSEREGFHLKIRSVMKQSPEDRNHPILRGVIAPHQEFLFFVKIMIFLDF